MTTSAWSLLARGFAALVERHTEAPLWGLLDEPRFNVVALNLALDAGH